MTITIDRREVQEHPDIPELIEIPFIIDTLDAADYAFLDRHNEPLGIERAEIGDLLNKLRSGRLEDQLLRCSEAYSSVILLVEGVFDKVDGYLAVHKESNRGYFRHHIYPHTRYNDILALLVRLSELGIEIIPSPNFSCSIVAVGAIYNQRTKPEVEHTLFKKLRPINMPVKLSNNPAVPKLMTLVPRLPEKTAIRLINQFGSIWNILHVDDMELLAVTGFGKGLLAKLKKEVGKDGD